MSKYYKLTISCIGEEAQEELIGLLHFFSEFESVNQLEDSIIVSYLSASQDREELISRLTESLPDLQFTIEDEPDINWNEKFEKSFQPLRIMNNSWGVRATFHPPMNTAKEIIIDPKMSFGTGHHATTQQMMEQMSVLNFQNKTVWDYGSGTGILAIMASMLGASIVKANDNEEWAYLNSIENATLNSCTNLEIALGDIPAVESSGLLKQGDQFDVIIANITKNILLGSTLYIDLYSKPGTILLLSGFYIDDISDILDGFKTIGFQQEKQSSMDNWACLRLVKN